MRKKLLAALTAGLMMAGLFGGAALAGHSDDRPDHNPQDKGLCTAYFNGKKKGHDKHGNPPPFQDLVERADDGDSDTSVTDDVASYCGALVGGNPEHGRYPDCFENGGYDGDCSS